MRQKIGGDSRRPNGPTQDSRIRVGNHVALVRNVHVAASWVVAVDGAQPTQSQPAVRGLGWISMNNSHMSAAVTYRVHKSSSSRPQPQYPLDMPLTRSNCCFVKADTPPKKKEYSILKEMGLDGFTAPEHADRPHPLLNEFDVVERILVIM